MQNIFVLVCVIFYVVSHVSYAQVAVVVVVVVAVVVEVVVEMVMVVVVVAVVVAVIVVVVVVVVAVVVVVVVMVAAAVVVVAMVVVVVVVVVVVTAAAVRRQVCCHSVCVDFIFEIIFLPTGPIMCGQGLLNDLQMYNYVQTLSNTSKLSLNSSSSSEALKNVTGYPVPNQPQVSSLDRINPVLLKKESSKVSCIISTVSLRLEWHVCV